MTAHTVFVLSGGATLGAVQVGMLRALLEAGIVPDAVVGASVGAINGVFMAADPTLAQAERLEALWRATGKGDVFPGSRLRVAWQLARRRLHLHDPAPMRAMIRRWLGVDDLADTAVPVHVATTALRSGRVHWWTEGDATEVLVASASLPCVFPPVELAGELHVDGALISPLPLQRALSLGPRRVVVLDAGVASQAVPARPVTALDVLLQSFRAARLERLEAERAALAQADVEVLWLPAVDGGRASYDDLSRTSELIAAGYRAGQASTRLTPRSPAQVN